MERGPYQWAWHVNYFKLFVYVTNHSCRIDMLVDTQNAYVFRDTNMTIVVVDTYRHMSRRNQALKNIPILYAWLVLFFPSRKQSTLSKINNLICNECNALTGAQLHDEENNTFVQKSVARIQHLTQIGWTWYMHMCKDPLRIIWDNNSTPYLCALSST